MDACSGMTDGLPKCANQFLIGAQRILRRREDKMSQKSFFSSIFSGIYFLFNFQHCFSFIPKRLLTQSSARVFLHCVPKRLYQPGENELLPKWRWGTQFFLLTLFSLVSEMTPVHWSPIKCWEYLSTLQQQPSDFWPPGFCDSQYQELVLVPGTSR